MTTNKKFFAVILHALVVTPLTFTSNKLAAESALQPTNSQVQQKNTLTTQSAENQSPLPRPVAPANVQPIVNTAYLYTVLPNSAFAYARIPNLWWPIGGVAIGNIFDQLIKSAPNAEAILAIRRGILDRFTPELPQEWRGLAKFLLSQVNTPLELAILAPSKNQPLPLAMPELLLTTGLNQFSVEATNLLLQNLAIKTPGLEFPEPLQEDGTGKLLIYGKPIDLYFNAAQQRLFIKIALPNPKGQPLAEQVSALKPTTDHPMLVATKGIDDTGQGLLFWLNPKTTLHVADIFGLAKEFNSLHAMGIADAHSIAFGVGGSGGKQHLKLILDMPQIGVRNFLPTFDTDIKFNAANELDMVFMLGLPNVEYLKTLEANLKIWLSQEDYQEYQIQKATVPQVTGLTAEQILDTFGKELLMLHDQVGYYAALKLRNSDNFQTLLQYLIQKFKLKHETKELFNTTFHHLVLPQLIPSHLTDIAATPDSFNTIGFIHKLVDQPTHIYWIEHQGYLVFASIPQVLMDMLYATPKINVANWLRQSQGINPNGALTLISTRATGIPRLLYEMHLWSLSYLSDMVANPIDLFSFPSAHELNLPNSGAYSVQFVTAPNQLALEMVYESSPFEVLMSFGLQTLASAGIVAAIAIPSLIDNKKDESIPQTTIEYIKNLQVKLAEFYNVMGRFPAINELQTVLANNSPIEGIEVTLLPDTGSIILILPNKCKDTSCELILAPTLNPNGINWKCEGSLSTNSISSEICTQ